MTLLDLFELFASLISDATITWTLPPPERGPLQTSDNTIRSTIQQVIKGSSEARLTWSFTLSGVILDRVAFRKGFLRIGKKTSSGVVTVEQEHFNISRSEPATLIIYNVTEADEALYSCDVETDKKTWTDTIQVKVGGKWMKNVLVFKHFYYVHVHLCVVISA